LKIFCRKVHEYCVVATHQSFAVWYLQVCRSFTIKVSKSIHVVLLDTCGSNYTFRVDGPNSSSVGEGDFHEPEYDFLVANKLFYATSSQYEGTSPFSGPCQYNFRIYPSATLEANYTTNKPTLYCIAVICVFAFTVAVFALYNYLVQCRQNLVEASAKCTSAIVLSLFPKNVRDQILDDSNDTPPSPTKGTKKTFIPLSKIPIAKLDKEIGDKKQQSLSTRPIANLFPNATILFADIAGFTAWSSEREPCQVFTLLETVYWAFDEMALKCHVFKGDSWRLLRSCHQTPRSSERSCRDYSLLCKRCCSSHANAYERSRSYLGT
jgi:hypothetical protein